MEALLEFYGDKRCPVCGKRFTVLWPHQWAFKRGKPHPTFYCSWKCLRTLDKKGDENMKTGKVTRSQKENAVQIALGGGDPLQYLESCGAGNAPQMWYAIKQNLKENDPDIYAKLPKRIDRKDTKQKEAPTLADAIDGMTDAANEFFSKCEDMGLKVNGDPVTKPSLVTAGPITVTAIRHKSFGEFYHDHDHNCIDWRTPEGDEMSLSLQGWKDLIAELPGLLKILGVDA